LEDVVEDIQDAPVYVTLDLDVLIRPTFREPERQNPAGGPFMIITGVTPREKT